MATIKLKDESSKTFSIDGVCYTKGDYRLQYNAKKEVLIIPKAVANISNLSGLPFKNPIAWTYFVDADDNPYGSFEEFSLAISDAINFNSGEAAPTLQQVTDNGNTTTNDIKVSKLYLKDSASELNGRLYLDSNNWFFEDSDGVVRFIATEGSIFLKNRTSEKEAVINTNLLTANRTYTLPDTSGTIALLPEIANDFVNDAAAAIGGIAVGSLYHTSGVVKIRLS